MGSKLNCSLVTLCLLLGACGEAKNDFFDETATASGSGIPSTQSSSASAGGTETGMTGSPSSNGAGGSDAGGSDAGGSDAGGSDAGGSDAGGSDAGGSASESTATAASTEAAAASDTTSGGGTTTSTATSTTGAANDPECPESAPEGTTFCNVAIGLSCTYGEVTCVCSGLTWNCRGGETTSSSTGNSMGTGFVGNGNGANNFGTGGTFND